MILVLSLTFAGTSQAATEIKVGDSCKRLATTTKVGLVTYRCSLVGGSVNGLSLGSLP
jgi:hypothetical protein